VKNTVTREDRGQVNELKFEVIVIGVGVGVCFSKAKQWPRPRWIRDGLQLGPPRFISQALNSPPRTLPLPPPNHGWKLSSLERNLSLSM